MDHWTNLTESYFVHVTATGQLTNPGICVHVNIYIYKHLFHNDAFTKRLDFHLHFYICLETKNRSMMEESGLLKTLRRSSEHLIGIIWAL